MEMIWEINIGLLLGLFIFASIYHDLWNYNLATSDKSAQTIIIILIIFGLLTSKLLTNDLNNQ